VVPEIELEQFAVARAGDGALVVDVREPEEFRGGHVPHARPLPMAELPWRIAELPTDRPVYVVCRSGRRSARAAAWLRSRRVEAYSVRGGTAAWIAAGHPVSRGEAGR
jgi:rhodanese-related sulfurtransferase